MTTNLNNKKLNFVQNQFYAFCDNLPLEVSLDGKTYRHIHTFKCDFFAGTGLYELTDESAKDETIFKRIVVKIYRYRSFFLIPMRWFGKLSVRHESRLYKILDDIEGVPKFVGFIGQTGFAHEFIEGDKLANTDKVNDEFFDRLEHLLQQIHNRDVAYVDLNKPENILLGNDGKPYLVDFQISYTPRLQLPLISSISRAILRQLQIEDEYHFAKHKRKLRPDLLTPEDYALTYKRSIPIRIHRILTRPYFAIRHLIMDLLDLTPAE